MLSKLTSLEAHRPVLRVSNFQLGQRNHARTILCMGLFGLHPNKDARDVLLKLVFDCCLDLLDTSQPRRQLAPAVPSLIQNPVSERTFGFGNSIWHPSAF